VADVDKVYLSPDGIFNKINFITLYNPQTEKYVLNEISINYLTNTNVILNKTNNGHAPVDPKIQLFGNADFSQGVSSTNSTGPAIDPLPGTGEEIREISSLLESKSWSSTVFENSSANEKSLKEVKNINILHIATHGFFLSDKSNNDDFYSIENNPLMRSGLLLTSAQNAFMGDHIKFSSGDDEDGVLTAYEVMNMDLSGTQLVVLSACETGLGEVKNGEGVYGLQRAFIIAGAESLIISLWKVSDDATRDLMIRFYEIYLENHDKFEALALAQKDMLEKYKNPYYWGAFVISGI
jgi:CHAT domain-containing protein